MTDSQMIVFQMALQKLMDAIPRQEIMSGAALGLHKDREGNPVENKYTGWAKESDAMKEELKEAKRLLLIIEKEITNQDP